MAIKITNEEQLAEYKRELERMEFQHSGAQEQINKLRAAIADYERNRDDARVAEIAAGLSDKAKAGLEFFVTGENSIIAALDACRELEGKQLVDKRSSVATPLGLKVLAELQKHAQLPERWGVFGVDSSRMYCECQKEEDAITIRTALFRYGLSTYVRKI